jgi:hypothetical protein
MTPTKDDLLKMAQAAGLEEEFLVDPLSEHRFRVFSQIAAQALTPTVQEPLGYLEIDDIESQREYPHNCRNVNLWHEGGEGMAAIYTTPPAAPKVVDCHATGVCVQSGLRAEVPAPVQPVALPTDAQIAATAGRIGGFSDEAALGKQWDDVYLLVRRVITERTTATPPAPTVQELVYQIRYYENSTAWHDVGFSAYTERPEKDRRILYTTPPAANPTTEEPSAVQPAPVQEPSFKEWTQDYVRDNIHKLKTTPPAAPKVVDCHATGVCVQSGLRAEKPAPEQRKLVGDSRFESWFSEDFDPKGKGTKQQMREAYEAGMNDAAATPHAQPAPVQEPVAWILTEELTRRKTTTGAHLWFSDPVNCMWTPIYTTPIATPVQEPVAWSVIGKVTDWSKDFHPYRTKIHQRPVYTTPPAQPAVPLTDELSNAVQMACQLSYKDHGRRSVNEQAWQRLMQAVAACTHGITKGGAA